MDNGYVRFDAKLSNKIKGNKVPVTITSSLTALNVNKEVDSKLFGETSTEFTIYATGEENIIVEQRLGNAGSEVEKNAEFSYLLTAYNNTDTDVNNYSIVDILPYDKDLTGEFVMVKITNARTWYLNGEWKGLRWQLSSDSLLQHVLFLIT